MMRGIHRGCFWLLLTLLLAGCASGPPKTAEEAPDWAPAMAAVYHARQVIGTPYRWGGESVERGFDCSGLIWYAYRKAGLEVPRTTTQQLRAMYRVRRTEAQPGDILFFRLPDKSWHVGLYAGDNRFIHAPSSGKTVSVARMDNPYWRSRLYHIGRIY